VKPRCPHCGKPAFKYLVLAQTFFPSRSGPKPIRCPSCGGYACLSRQSQLVWVLLFLFAVATIAAVAKLNSNLTSAGVYLFSVAVYIFWTLAWASVWPWIVKLQSWQHHLDSGSKPWLPKSRMVGYLVYLLLPIAVMVALFAFAVHEGWEM